jgi:hypothetical protein
MFGAQAIIAIIVQDGADSGRHISRREFKKILPINVQSWGDAKTLLSILRGPW